MHGGAIMTGSIKMNVVTAISVIAILGMTVTTSIATTGAIITEITVIGTIGAGIVTVIGWGFGFLIEELERKS